MLRLKELRLSKGLSQADIAKQLGVTQQAYANYERGAREADYETLKKLSKLFGCSVDYILDYSDVRQEINADELFERFSEAYKKQTGQTPTKYSMLGVSDLTHDEVDSLFCKNSEGLNDNTIKKLAKALNITVDYLLGRTDDPSSASTKPDEELLRAQISTFGDPREYSEEELSEIKTFLRFVKQKREEK